MRRLLSSLRAHNAFDRASPVATIYGPLGKGGGLAILILLAFAAARTVLAFTLDFGIDEAYTLAVARRLSWSYFDHPPLHQWIAHLAASLLGEGLAVRLPFIALFCVTGWFIFALTRDSFGARAGHWAIFALNATPFFFASAGGWIVPDGPLLVALSASAFFLGRLLFRADAHIWRNWLVVGLCLGLAGLSKYNALFFPLGVLLFLALSPDQRRWFAHPAPYCAAALAIVMILPVLIWNADNGWVSFFFQGGRSVASGRWRPAQALAMMAGQIGFLSPWIFVPLVWAAVTSLRRIRDGSPEAGPRLLLLSVSLPAIVIFTVTPVWGARGLPHWPMPGWIFVYPLLGAALAHRSSASAGPRYWAYGSAAALALIAVLVVAQARTGFAMRLAPWLAGGDPTLEALNWSPIRDAPLLRDKNNRSFVVATKWSEAGKIAGALGPETPVMVFSNDPRGFAFLDDPATFLHENAVVVVARKRLEETILALSPYFATLGPPQYVSFGRSGAEEIDLAIFTAKDLSRPYPLPYPRRSSATNLEGAS
jgi:Dolichyl-phosphate-mannose-protein mannosyltransferase